MTEKELWAEFCSKNKDKTLEVSKKVIQISLQNWFYRERSLEPQVHMMNMSWKILPMRFQRSEITV